MNQTALFATTACDAHDDLHLPDADVRFYAHLFSPPDADRLLAKLMAETEWQQEQIKIHGKQIPIPRLTAWCGEPNKTYTYSGIRVVASPWTDALREIKTRIEEISDTTFNSVLLNRYRIGSDSVAWHADDERELGKNPIIGSVSLGAPRKFQLKHKTNPAHKKSHNIELTHGSYLLMAGETQHHWIHQIPKTKTPIGERINLTFRDIVDWSGMKEFRNFH